MKIFLQKLRVSNALDSERAMPSELKRQAEASGELNRFYQGAVSLEQRLRESVPQQKAPDSLQGDVMRALRSGAVKPRRGSWNPVWKWATVPVGAAVVVLLGWGLLSKVAVEVIKGKSLASPGVAIETSGRVAQTAPDVLVSPLTDELDRLNRDLTATAEFLLASVP